MGQNAAVIYYSWIWFKSWSQAWNFDTKYDDLEFCIFELWLPKYLEKLVFKNSYNLFLLKPSSKVSTQKVSLKVYKKLSKVKFFCIFLPSNQKLALKYCIFIKIDSNFSNFITIWFDKFFETGKFEVKSHIVHCFETTVMVYEGMEFFNSVKITSISFNE